MDAGEVAANPVARISTKAIDTNVLSYSLDADKVVKPLQAVR